MKHILLFYVALLLAGCSGEKQAGSPIQKLPVVKVSSGSGIIYKQYPASVQGAVDVEIRPQVTGILEKVYVDEGAFVKAGTVLFKINETPFLERLNNAKASLRSAKGVLSGAQLEIEKLKPLVEHKVISDYQLKTAQSAYETALGSVEQANADIATAKINLGYTLIKAPVSGYVGRLLRKQGSLVGPADPIALTDLSDVHDVHVYFALGEYDFIRFKEQYPGKTLEEKIKQLPKVDLILADDSAYSESGKIDLIDGQFNKNTGAISIRATFPNHDGLLRAGNTGKIKMGLQFGSQVIVPQSATLEMQDKVYVFLLKENNTVTKQNITISGKSGNNFLVRDGLKPNDRIVSGGFDHLKEGDTIKPGKTSVTAALTAGK